jgi:predicted DNA-binding protein with PD1-like motif
VGRLLPGSDLIHGLEEACDHYGLEYAAIAFAYGSLSSASFKILNQPEPGEQATLVPYAVPQRVEFLGGQGLVCRDDEGNRATHLHGSISDHDGVVRGGHFNPGENPIFNNLDFLLVELTGVRLVRSFDEETATVEMIVYQVDQESAS